MRGEEGHVWKTVENSGSSTVIDKPYQCSVCVREHSESKTLIDTDVSPLVRNINNCDLVCHLWQRSIIRWVASFQDQGQGVCYNVTTSLYGSLSPYG